jgi:hypothetical protein
MDTKHAFTVRFPYSPSSINLKRHRHSAHFKSTNVEEGLRPFILPMQMCYFLIEAFRWCVLSIEERNVFGCKLFEAICGHLFYVK